MPILPPNNLDEAGWAAGELLRVAPGSDQSYELMARVCLRLENWPAPSPMLDRRLRSIRSLLTLTSTLVTLDDLAASGCVPRLRAVTNAR
jgi:hypothetical protein